ncbi:MAG: hypothetical protein PHG58_06435, partial [Clostridia bacterium]|nr:hypothetical protein [Clostridia bacterium]
MNKKRFTIFLSVLFCIILFPVLLLISKQPTKETSILTASNQEDIHQFYYRSVPGLEMAEEAGLVREVNRKLDWPGKSASIYIDHIWYNTKFVYLFYHAEGFPSAAYLGGDLFVPSSEPMEKQSFHGSASIGSSSERGILFNESYYSCLCLSPLKDRSGKLFSQLDMICFAPYINIPNPDKYEIIESTQLKSFEIPLNYHEEEENTVKYFFDKQLELEGKKLYFYQINVSPSKLKLYFQYLNSGKD